MSSISVDTEFIAVGCNRMPQVAAWSIDGIFAFGAHNTVAISYPQDPTCRGVLETLIGHQDRVSCVAFLQRGSELEQKSVALVSGSVDKTLRVWRHVEGNGWVCSAILQGHLGTVTTIGVLRARSLLVEKDLIVSGSADGTIRVWERELVDKFKDKVECVQVIEVGVKYPLALALSYLPNSTIPVLAVGSTEKKIGVYIQKNGCFQQTLTLQGHENWVRSLSFAVCTSPDVPLETSSEHSRLQENDLLLASASQDKYIRLWRFTSKGFVKIDESKSRSDFNTTTLESEGNLTQSMLEALEESILLGDTTQLSTKAHIIEVEAQNNEKHRYSVIFEALLMGHDDWVYSIDWQKPTMLTDSDGNSKYHQPMVLLSASSDRSMMLWKPDPETGIWINQVRVGEVGGAALGFYGGLFGPNGSWIIGHSYHGAFHLWQNVGGEKDSRLWAPQVVSSGHFDSVQNLAWDPRGQFLISVSHDQTSRLFSPWIRTLSDNATPLKTWHEIARPQVHGYDLQCLTFINSWRYVSGADEKVMRVFDAPRTFVENLANLTGSIEPLDILNSRPVGASLPPLGLSNKAIFEGDIEEIKDAKDEFHSRQLYTHASATPTSLVERMVRPPFEEHLMQHTLWPEIDKLYGHGFEIFAMDSTHDEKLVASSCKAATPEHAVIRLFDAATWKELPNPLKSHSLTVTKVRFSHDDRWLLSTSRDRFWTLFERDMEENAPTPYKLAFKEKAHARIIWDCAWSHDDTFFITGSRDKTAKVWCKNIDSNDWKAVATLRMQHAVTAVSVAPCLVRKNYVLALGLENGEVHIFESKEQDLSAWTSLTNENDTKLFHSATVNSLAWKPVSDEQLGSVKTLLLASGGSDHAVRLMKLVVS
ncbi:uncharacterized protein VTP21DRAFT_4352 [Calcarisporiella thermophila]|uniref:uncharacterized protein n=1 Tax=Calcarisporiella thermophila TaxID=911321 RepID=UPI00374492FF